MNLVICDRCGESKATMDCEQCKVPFCDKCSKSIHQKGKWASHILKQRPFEKPARSSAEMPNDQNPERSQYLREQVLKEIVQTEREYLKSLEALSKIYVAPIKAGKFPDANLGTLVVCSFIHSFTLKYFIHHVFFFFLDFIFND